MEVLLFLLRTPAVGDVDGCGVFHRDSGTIGGEEMLLVKSPLISLSLRDL